jgi:2',3'-cyclic-nucleotide 2'-phosphodiesterase (5'-nucleotidase family)
VAVAGLPYLAAFADHAEFPVLGACNMDTSKEPILNGKIKKWATFKKGGMNIAVLGYTNVNESKEMVGLTKNLQFYDHVRSPFLLHFPQ